jgi:hypothetical protein
MVPCQLAELKNHNKKMEHYIYRLKKRGKEELAYKVQKKRDKLKSHIQELEQ